jgi:hypothetical protein
VDVRSLEEVEGSSRISVIRKPGQPTKVKYSGVLLLMTCVLSRGNLV